MFSDDYDNLVLFYWMLQATAEQDADGEKGWDSISNLH